MKVFIASAGTGSRLGHLTKDRNKALVSVGVKPAITHIIEKFDAATEFVVATGYQGNLLKNYLIHAHPNVKFSFVEIECFEGPGSGLGHTFNQCKHLLQEPFIFVPNDTIILETNIILDPVLYGNWIGTYAKKREDGVDRQHYRCVEISSEIHAKIKPKGILTENIYIGLCGIKDIDEFWNAMSDDDAIEAGESYGLNKLNTLRAVELNDWIDTGNLESLSRASKKINQTEYNVLEKADEAIWILEDCVIKYHKSPKFIADRITRTEFLPSHLLPHILHRDINFFKYRKIVGEVASKSIDNKLIDILQVMQSEVWSKKCTDINHKQTILNDFYYLKTLERLQLYQTTFEETTGPAAVNGLMCDNAFSLVEQINWEKVYATSSFTRFHGDFHPENILISSDGTITLLDWRQNFGEKNYEYGDVYYDLSKMLHGLLVEHKKVAGEAYSVESFQNDIKIDIELSLSRHLTINKFETWVVENNYDLSLVKLLTGLIYLNIAALHHYPYSKFLLHLGTLILQLELKNGSHYIIKS